ncbi:unnamed protein product, partial [Brassica oleracea var. botrytis]
KKNLRHRHKEEDDRDPEEDDREVDGCDGDDCDGGGIDRDSWFNLSLSTRRFFISLTLYTATKSSNLPYTTLLSTILDLLNDFRSSPGPYHTTGTFSRHNPLL